MTADDVQKLREGFDELSDNELSHVVTQLAEASDVSVIRESFHLLRDHPQFSMCFEAAKFVMIQNDDADCLRELLAHSDSHIELKSSLELSALTSMMHNKPDTLQALLEQKEVSDFKVLESSLDITLTAGYERVQEIAFQHLPDFSPSVVENAVSKARLDFSHESVEKLRHRHLDEYDVFTSQATLRNVIDRSNMKLIQYIVESSSMCQSLAIEDFETLQLMANAKVNAYLSDARVLIEHHSEIQKVVEQCRKENSVSEEEVRQFRQVFVKSKTAAKLLQTQLVDISSVEEMKMFIQRHTESTSLATITKLHRI